MADPLPDDIADIRVYVEGADGLHGRPFLPDHAIDVLQDICQERQRQTDVCGHGRAEDDGLLVGDFVDLIADRSEAAIVASTSHDKPEARRRMLQVAALAMASVEMLDRWLGIARADDPAEVTPAGPGVEAEEAVHG